MMHASTGLELCPQYTVAGHRQGKRFPPWLTLLQAQGKYAPRLELTTARCGSRSCVAPYSARPAWAVRAVPGSVEVCADSRRSLGWEVRRRWCVDGRMRVCGQPASARADTAERRPCSCRSDRPAHYNQVWQGTRRRGMRLIAVIEGLGQSRGLRVGSNSQRNIRLEPRG